MTNVLEEAALEAVSKYSLITYQNIISRPFFTRNPTEKVSK
jgi:hypothetical protein